MVNYCVAFGCRVRAGQGYSFFKFPDDETRRKAWCHAIRRKNFKPMQHSKLCSKHFTADDYEPYISGYPKLKKESVPSIFEFPQNVGPTLIKSRKSPLSRKNPEVPICNVLGNSSGEGDGCSVDASKCVNVHASKKRKAYLGDFKEDDLTSSTEAEKFLKLSAEKLNEKVIIIADLRRKNRRLTEKVQSMQSLIDVQREKMPVGENACNTLKVHFEESQFEQHRADNWKKLKQTAIPTLFNVGKPPPLPIKGIAELKLRPLLQTLLTNEPQNVSKPAEKKDSVFSGAKESDQFILPDVQPPQEKKLPDSPEPHHDDLQCSNVAAITIKEEIILPDDYDWNPTIIEHSITSLPPHTSKESNVFAPSTSDCGSRAQSFIAPIESKQTDIKLTVENPALARGSIPSNPIPVLESSVSLPGQACQSESKFTNLVLSSGRQSLINHQISRSEFFPGTEIGSEKAIAIHLPKKPRTFPTTSFNEDPISMDSASTLGDLPLSGQTTDRLECFGNYIVSRLRMMDNRTSLLVQKAINDIIFEAEMGKLVFEMRSDIG